MIEPASMPSDSDLRAYLLNLADERQQASIDTYLFTEPGAHERLLAAEQAIIDEYVAGALSRKFRDAIERRLVKEPRLQEAVRVSRAFDRLQTASSKAPLKAPQARQQGWSPRSVWFVRSLGLATAVVLALVVVGPDLGRESEPAFQAKGGGTALFRARCTPSCRAGGQLGFEVMAPAKRPYFAAFGRRPDGRIVWYEPSDAGAMRAADQGARMWPSTFELGAEHIPGEHIVFGIFSSRPFTRGDIAAAMGDRLEGGSQLTVFRRVIQILEAP